MLPLLLATLLVPAQQPNIVLINADDLGINDLGCYGRTDHATPHLDRLASEGMRFTSAYCGQPICSPSRAALLTGKHAARLHLTTYLPGRADAPSQKLLHPRIRQQLPREEITLAEYLRRAGYATACIGKWHLGGKGAGPADFGFTTVFAAKANTTPSATEGGKGEYELTRRAEQFLSDHRDRPFFLYLAHNNPHIPLAARDELIKKHAKAFHPLYAAVIETLDDSVGQLLRKLDELKLRERTVVLFTSDNGGLHVPELRDHAPTHNSPFRAGKGFLYEGGLRIPLIVRFPGVVRPGTVQHTPVLQTDLVPTLLELVGRDIPTGLDGISFAGLLRGKELPARSLYWHFPHYNNQGGRPGGAVRQGDWKLVHHYDTNRSELYHLGEDPGEKDDRAAREPARVRQMLADLVAWRKQIGAQENTPNPDFDPALYRQLYEDVDVSKLRPARTAAEMTPGLQRWRQLMDRVVSGKKATR
jgi:arylsulfatase A